MKTPPKCRFELCSATRNAVDTIEDGDALVPVSAFLPH